MLNAVSGGRPLGNLLGRRPEPGLLILILILTAVIAGTTAYVYKTAYDSLEVTFTDESPVLEFGKSYPAMSFVKDSSGEIYPESDYLISDSVGSKKIVYTATKPLFGGIFNPAREFTMEYTVRDDIPPLKIWTWDGAVLQRGSEFDINELIAYGDNADPTPLVSVDGKVNMEKNGKYPDVHGKTVVESNYEYVPQIDVLC